MQLIGYAGGFCINDQNLQKSCCRHAAAASMEVATVSGAALEAPSL